MLAGLFLLLFRVLMLNFFVCLSRFLNCLIILEKFKIILLLFRLLMGVGDNHIMFIVLMVVSTIEVVVGLVVLTRLWECVGSLELGCF